MATKNWFDNSTSLKVSLPILERGFLFFLIGLSVILGGTHLLGSGKGFLLGVFVPAMAWCTYQIEVNLSHRRSWANLSIFGIVVLMVIIALTSLWNVSSETGWNPLPLMLLLQLLTGMMVFERRYLSLVLETTVILTFLFLCMVGETLWVYCFGCLFMIGLVLFLRVSFQMAQWSQTINQNIGIWHTPMFVSAREIGWAAVEAAGIILIGLCLGFLLLQSEWKVSLPVPVARAIEGSFRIDPKALKLVRLKKEEEALEEMKKLLLKKPATQLQVEPEIQKGQEGGQLTISSQKAEPIALTPLTEEKEEVKPIEISWHRFFIPLGLMILIFLILSLLGMWIYFWLYRMRTRKEWVKLRRESPKQFLKEWLEYWRYLLEKYGVQADLHLSPAEYLEGVATRLKISTPDTCQLRQILLKGWYSSRSMMEEEMGLLGIFHQAILEVLKKRGAWYRRVEFHCLRVVW